MTVTANTPFEIEGRAIKPGERASIEIPVIEMADGSIVRFKVEILRGRQPGPVFYFGAGIHGDEVGGIAILAEALSRLDVAKIKGTVIAVPVQNPIGFQAQHRVPLNLVLKSPTDQSPNDIYLSYPGDADGNSTQIMAHVLYGLMSKADFIIDLHTPTVGGRYVSFAFLPPPNIGPAALKARELAHAFGVEAVLSTTIGIYVDPDTAHVVAAKRGIPAFGVEMGEGGRVEPDLVERGARGVLNALRHVGILEGPPESRPVPFGMKEFVLIRARRGGLLQPTVRLGDMVTAGQQIARIVSPSGQLLETIATPVAGLFVRATTFPSVCTGERVGQIGVPE